MFPSVVVLPSQLKFSTLSEIMAELLKGDPDTFHVHQSAQALLQGQTDIGQQLQLYSVIAWAHMRLGVPVHQYNSSQAIMVYGQEFSHAQAYVALTEAYDLAVIHNATTWQILLGCRLAVMEMHAADRDCAYEALDAAAERLVTAEKLMGDNLSEADYTLLETAERQTRKACSGITWMSAAANLAIQQ